MFFQARKIAVLIFCSLLSSEAFSLEGGSGNTAIPSSWLVDDQLLAMPEAAPGAVQFPSRTQTWASGLVSSRTAAFTPSNFDRTVGAKLRPVRDWNFALGTELTRSGDSHLLSSKAMWEMFWSQDAERSGGYKLDFSTTGSVDNVGTDYLQSFSGNVNIPVDLPLDAWTVQVRLSPSMNVDVSSGAVSSSLLSEFVGETVLSAHKDAVRSTLNITLGYSVAPDARPNASAKLELRLIPDL